MTNPLRSGLLATLREMGADITVEREANQCGDSTTAIEAPGPGEGDGSAGTAMAMIDEYLVLAVASAATGSTRMQGLQELRVKESDRLAAVEAGLKAVGVTCRIEGDDLIVEGSGGGPVSGGGPIATHLDHRIAMSFVMGLATREPVMVDDGAMIATSFPELRRADERARRPDRMNAAMRQVLFGF